MRTVAGDFGQPGLSVEVCRRLLLEDAHLAKQVVENTRTPWLLTAPGVGSLAPRQLEGAVAVEACR